MCAWGGLQEERARGERAAERVRAVKQWRADLAERQSSARELRVARNRFVLRAHERLLRDANRAKDDDRARRMDALKVRPFSEYSMPKRAMITPRASPAAAISRCAIFHTACRACVLLYKLLSPKCHGIPGRLPVDFLAPSHRMQGLVA